jgi:phage FluMu protein Com
MRARRPRSVQVHGCARLRRAYQQRLPWVRAPPARISAAPALGARASGAHISSACPGCARLRRAYQQRLPWVRAPPARISAAPALGARASGAHISSACPGCARLRRAYQQRLPWVRAPPARISAAPALGARASGAHISSACPGCARLRRAYQQRLPWVRAPPARMPARICLRRAGGRDARAPGRVGYPRDEQLPLHCAVTPAPLSPAPATRRQRRRCPVARRCWRPSRASE